MTITSQARPSSAQALPRKRLEERIIQLSSQIAGATCELLLLIGEFDAVDGWGAWGMASTSAWLSWQCGVGRTAAREQVRVAKALREFPSIVSAFREGRLSYSKVRAITRIATTDTVDLLVDWAQHATAAQLERIVAGQRRAERNPQVRAQHAARSLSWRWDDDGSLVGSFRLPPDQGVRFLQAIEIARGALPEVPDEVADAEAGAAEPCEGCRNASAEAPAPHRFGCAAAEVEAEPARIKQRSSVDALMFMAGTTVTAVEQSADSEDDGVGLPGLGAERFSLVLHASAEAPDGELTTDDGITLHPLVGRRLSCGCPYSVQTDDANGNPLHLGRRTRRIRGRLARAVHARDGGRCQAPGCRNRTRQIHHIIHWADGGVTCIENLVSLCDSHHWLVHEGGWNITGKQGHWQFKASDGRVLQAAPQPTSAATPLAGNAAIRPNAIVPTQVDATLDLDMCLFSLWQAANLRPSSN